MGHPPVLARGLQAGSGVAGLYTAAAHASPDAVFLEDRSPEFLIPLGGNRFYYDWPRPAPASFRPELTLGRMCPGEQRPGHWGGRDARGPAADLMGQSRFPDLPFPPPDHGRPARFSTAGSLQRFQQHAVRQVIGKINKITDLFPERREVTIHLTGETIGQLIRCMEVSPESLK